MSQFESIQRLAEEQVTPERAREVAASLLAALGLSTEVPAPQRAFALLGQLEGRVKVQTNPKLMDAWGLNLGNGYRILVPESAAGELRLRMVVNLVAQLFLAPELSWGLGMETVIQRSQRYSRFGKAFAAAFLGLPETD